MKRKVSIIISILVILTLTACGPAPTPTLSVDDIRNAAMTQAWVAMTMTQAALPTATITPVPPSPTPMPTYTPFPTLPAVVATSVPPTSSVDPCNQVPPVKPKGTLVKVLFVNKSGGNVNLSFGMNQPNDQSECVTYSYTLGTFQQIEATVLAGCYWGYGWVDGKNPSTARTTELICLNDASKTPPVWIGTEVIALH